MKRPRPSHYVRRRSLASRRPAPLRIGGRPRQGVLAVGLLAVALVCGCLVAACGQEVQAGAPPVVKVGVLYPVSGPLVEFGQEMVTATRIAADEINAAGGIKSLGGAQIKLDEADSQGDPTIGAAQVDKLVSDGVCAILGTYQSGVAIPAARAAERAKTPLLIAIAVADSITERGYEYVFRICPKADWYAKAQIDFCLALEELAGYKVERVALLYGTTDYGQSMAAAQKRYLQGAGFSLVGEISYAATGADLTTVVRRVERMDPDIVLTTTYLTDALRMARSRSRLGITVPFYDAAGGTMHPTFVNALGSEAEGWLGLIEFSKHVAGSGELNEAYRQRAGEDITGNGAYGYQSVYVLAAALEKAASTDPEKVRDALADLQMSAAAGDRIVIPTDSISFGPDGQITPPPAIYTFQIQGGTLKPIFPKEFAVAEPVLP